MDLPELLIQRGGSRLCRRVLLRIVHLQIPVDEVTLAKTNHLHTSKIKDTFDRALRYEWQAVDFVLALR